MVGVTLALAAVTAAAAVVIIRDMRAARGDPRTRGPAGGTGGGPAAERSPG